MASLKELRVKHLALARSFIDNGVPVFVAKPVPPGGKYDNRSEFFLPKKWNEIEPDYRYLEDWRPGWAVCAVTGVKFDVLDIDPRNGGDKAAAHLREVEHMPPVRGEVSTPSGGVHYYINRTGLKKFTPWTGIDLQAGNIAGHGRGFVYIPPTIRVSKVTGERSVYELTQDIDWSSLDKVGANNEGHYPEFREILVEVYLRVHAAHNAGPVGKNWEGRELTADETVAVFRRLIDLCMTLREAMPGEHDLCLYTYSRTVGGLIAGSGLDEDPAKQMLRAAAQTWITDDKDLTWIDYKIERSIALGKQRPITIHDWS